MSAGLLELPSITQQPVMHIDGTPDSGYPLRILQAYRDNCDCFWSETTDGKPPDSNPLLRAMNEHQRQRAELLDRAIAKLRGA